MSEPIVFDPGNGNFLVIDGHIVERDALRIAEKIADYDPALRLVCLDNEGFESVRDAPFMVVRDNGHGTVERVLEAWTLDDRIIERIWAADNSKHDILAKLVAEENRLKKDREDKEREEREANVELMAAAVTNKKSSFQFHNREGELVKIHDDRGKESPTNPKHFHLDLPTLDWRKNAGL